MPRATIFNKQHRTIDVGYRSPSPRLNHDDPLDVELDVAIKNDLPLVPLNRLSPLGNNRMEDTTNGSQIPSSWHIRKSPPYIRFASSKLSNQINAIERSASPIKDIERYLHGTILKREE